ncbi:MAG: TolC family protein [Acidobacteria bacterium]|nr:TolC family protein [Acidobacteriota bacterium]MSO61519.1 TolC family protein [Acidobacteriota bacterium]
MSLPGCVSLSRRLCPMRMWGVVALLVALLMTVAARPAAAQAVVPRPLGAGLIVSQPSADGTATPSVVLENPIGQITLRDALALALRQSPELASFAWEIRARESAAIQAGRPSNPVADILFEDLGASGRAPDDGRVVGPQTTVQLSQLIELGGKRAARRTLAGLDRDLAEWDFESARIDVLTRVTAAFLDVLASQQTLALAERNRALFDQVDQTVRTRVEAGVVSPIEQTKAGVALAMARIDAQRAQRSLAADRTALAALWGHSTALFESVAGDLLSPPLLPSFDALVQHVVRNPEVARWVTESARRDAARALESARGVPDVTVTAGYRRLSEIDSNAIVIGASIPLPFVDRNRAGVQAATQRVAQAREEERAARARITTLLAAAYRNLAAAHDEAAALASSVLPGARSAFAAVEEGYRLGRFGYLEVLDAQRTLVAAETQHLRALAEAHKAAAQVERLVGVPLADAATTPVKGQ